VKLKQGKQSNKSFKKEEVFIMLKNYAELFNGKSELEQLDVMEQMMLDAGFVMTVAKGSKGAKTYWFNKDGVENIFALVVRGDGRYLPIILPKDFAEHYYAKDGSLTKSISTGYHSYKDSVLVAKYNAVRLHRMILKFHGVDINGLEVDHVTCNQSVNTYNELRPCTSKQNKANKFGSHIKAGEFTYNPAHDFKNALWIPFLHYVLGVISYDEMHLLNKVEIAA
jgi:hypothetical protein